MHAELTHPRILLELANSLAGAQGDGGRTMRIRMGFVVEATHAFCDPALEERIDRFARDLEIRADAGNGPAGGMEPNDDEAAFCRIRNLGVHRIAPTYLGRPGPSARTFLTV